MGNGDARGLPRHPRVGTKREGSSIKTPAEERLAHLIREAARALTRGLTERLAGYSVPFGHWAFLRILWQEDGLTQRQLSDLAGMSEPTTFAAIKAMEEAGYVTRRQTAENRKNIYVHLTARGRALERKLVPLAEEVNKIAVRGVSAADVEATRRTLLAIAENLARSQK
ncbi:MAG TPA: MarR family transcriptional regulator [Burkholderiales bacterium]